MKRAKRARTAAPDIAEPVVTKPDDTAHDDTGHDDTGSDIDERDDAEVLDAEDARTEDQAENQTEDDAQSVPADVAITAEESDEESDEPDEAQMLIAEAVDKVEGESSADPSADAESAEPDAVKEITDTEEDAILSGQELAEDAETVTDKAVTDKYTGANAGEDADDEPGKESETTGAAETGAAETGAAETQSVERSALVMNAVKIRGRPGGVAIEIGEGEWAELLAVLRERLEIAEGFFRGGRVVLDMGDRALVEAELQAAFDVLLDFEMQMAVVRSSAETTLEAAALLGVTSTTGDVDDPSRGVVEVQVEEDTVREPTAYYVHQGNLRSGQVLERTESVIVIGDVNPGAQVVSHGDVLIYGRLRGSVHAGAGGDEQAMVTALEFAPTQLRIAAFTTVPPEDKKQSVGLLFWKKESEEQEAEYAYIADGRIYVEPWNAAKPGSMTSRRRR